MSSTSLGLGGNPIRFLGAYVKSVNTSLGLSGNPSTVTITIVEDVLEGVIFTPAEPGTYLEISIGSSFSFGGILQKYTIEARNISGKTISVVLNDPREAMSAVPMIIAPGFSDITNEINNNTGCSVLDVYGAYTDAGSGFNLSGYTDAGMPYSKIALAINGGELIVGGVSITVPQAEFKAYGERYRLDISAIDSIVDVDHLFNSNLLTLTEFIEDLSTKHAFDWYVTSTRAGDDIIDITVGVIDRFNDNIDVDLQDFLDARPDRIVSAQSGIELRNDLSCIVLQGAHVEQMKKVTIEGMANEPIDLVPESGGNAYRMTENEMRAVLGGKESWLTWLSISQANGGGGGFSRYGGSLTNDMARSMIDLRNIVQQINSSGNIPRRKERNRAYFAGAEWENLGRVYDKLKGHAESTYGKRFVHAAINDDVIESAWTRDVVAAGDAGTALKNKDPNEYFRQEDGRTRAYLEFTSQSSSAFSLGLNDLTNLFGNQDLFRNITTFGVTFTNVYENNLQRTIIDLELSNNFNIDSAVVNMDKSNYVYNGAKNKLVEAEIRTSLFVATTVDKDGVCKIESPVLEKTPNPYELINAAIQATRTSQAKEDDEYPESDSEPDSFIEFVEVSGAAGVGLIAVDTGDDLIKIEAGGGIGYIKRRDLAVGNGGNYDADANKEEEILSAYFKIIRMLGTFPFNIHAKAYQPKYAYIPTRSKTVRYGPAFPSGSSIDSQGKLQIIQDDGFAPWEFGSIALNNAAMQLKVNRANSNQKTSQSANIVVEGFPEFSIGDSLGENSNINNIQVSFGLDGVKTTYSLQSFTKKFGELTKQEILERLLTSSNANKFIHQPDRTGFNQRHRVNVNKNFSAGGGTGGGPSTLLSLKGGARNFG